MSHRTCVPSIMEPALRVSTLMRLLLLVLSIFSAWLQPVRASAADITADEAKLRAAIVLGVLRFTSWPNDISMASTFNLCTFGKPIAESALLQISGQRQFGKIPIHVKPIEKLEGRLSDCNALVLGNVTDRQLARDFLQGKGAYGVLTVCDSCKPGMTGAMVYLLRQENRIGFEIDLVEAQRQGMVFSSSLLELAVTVKQE